MFFFFFFAACVCLGAVRLAVRVRRQARQGPGGLPDLHGRPRQGDGRASPAQEDLLPEAQAVDGHHVRPGEASAASAAAAAAAAGGNRGKRAGFER